jgi:hypothetical protein
MDLVYSVILFLPSFESFSSYRSLFLKFFVPSMTGAHFFPNKKLTETTSSFQSCKNLAVVIG